MLKHLSLSLIAFVTLTGFSDNKTQKQNTQLILSCVETATFADRPGMQYLISIDKNRDKALINQKPVQLRGQDAKQWSVLAGTLGFVITESKRGIILRQKTEKINWAEKSLCWAGVQRTFISLESNNNGKYKGTINKGGYVAVDPSATDCKHPHFQRAPDKKIICSLY